MKSKTITFSQEDLDKAGYNISIQRPTAQERMIKIGIMTEEKVLKMFEKEKYLTAFGIAKKYHMPDRTAGGALERLRQKGTVTDSYKMLLSADKKHRLNHIFKLVKKNGRKRNNKKV